MIVNRRTLLRTGFAAAAATAIPTLAACSGGKKTGTGASGRLSASQLAAELDKPATLTFWTWVSGINDEVALFTKKYPKITVNVVNAGQGSAQYTKLRTALTAGTGAPDVAQIEFQYLPTFTITGDLVDLTPYGAADLKDKFIDWAWSQVTGDGKVYAVPQDTGPMGMLYRKDILDRYGIAVPTTWTDFADAARKLRSANPKMYLTNLPPNEPGAWTGLVWQAGSRPFTAKGKSSIGIALDDQAARKVADYWTPLVREGVVSTDPDFTDQWYQGLASNKYAVWLTAAWGPLFLQGTAKNTAGKWRAAPLPQWGGTPQSGNWGGSTSAVIRGTKHPAAAAALAQFLNSDPESARMMATKQFLYPATKALLADSSFVGQKLDFYGGQDVNKVFADISATVPKDFTWSPFQDQVYSSANDTLGKAITNKQDLSGGLAAWQSAVVDYAKKQGFTVTTS
jgi:multiple sugar transport system substrate-binding protein